jgi:prepilin-type N-terminal cleavage/methylation domain-containing protein
MMQPIRKRRIRSQAGFTLVEIAIALIIIGLLVGGILKGQGLVQQAKVRKLETQAEEIRAAVSAYYRSVGKLPGDTNNDSRISGAAEIDKVFPDLVDLNLITGSGTTRKHPFSGDDPAATVTIEYYDATNTNCIVIKKLPGDILLMLDTKYDDGVAGTGAVRSVGTTLYLPL